MTRLLEEAVECLRTLPEEEQDRAAEVLIAFTRERNDYSLDERQIDGVHHAMAQADSGEFVSDRVLREIFGRTL